MASSTIKKIGSLFKNKPKISYKVDRIDITYSADIKRLEGKVALVLGASSGIGKAIAINLAHNGAKVVIAARREDLLKEIADKINKNSQNACKYITCDVLQLEQIEKAVQFTAEKFGKLDIAVNNFGISGAQKVTDLTEEHYDGIMNTNVKGVAFAMRAQLKQMLQQKDTLSSIINIGSTLSTVGMSDIATYSASKHAVAGLTKTAALERYPNIRINCVCPGAIRTDMFGNQKIEDEFRIINNSKGYPVGHIGEPEEVASVVSFLASNEASFIHGAIIPVDGGFLCN